MDRGRERGREEVVRVRPDDDSNVRRPAVTREEMPVARGGEDVIEQTTQLITPRDRVRWGPIVAGLLTALGTFLILSTLALAIGATTVDTGAASAASAGKGSGIATAIIALLSFLLGGYVAAKTAAVAGTGNGLLNGFLVWALGIAAILLLAAFGLGQLFGSAGSLFGQYRSLGGNLPNPGNTNVNPQDIAASIKNGAWGAFASMLLPAIAAAIGGLLGAHGHEVEPVPSASNRMRIPGR